MQHILRSLRSNPAAIALLIAMLLAGTMFVVERVEILPLTGQAMPMYGTSTEAPRGRIAPRTRGQRRARPMRRTKRARLRSAAPERLGTIIGKT